MRPATPIHLRRATRRALLLACAVASATAASYAEAPRPAARAEHPVTVTVAGRPVDLAGDLHSQAVAIGRDYLHTHITLLTPNGPQRRTRWSVGARLDLAHLEALMRDAADARSPMRRVHAQVHAGEPLNLPLPLDLDEAQVMDSLLELKDELDRPPRNARVDTATRELLPHEAGRTVDVWATLDAIEAALHSEAESVRLVVSTEPAHRSIESISDVRMDAVLGHFETHYSTLETARDRAFNLGVAASRIDGTVLMPGEELDFNAVVGERNEANGFRVAPVIAAGELVDGIGGGTCQISGTLHAAVFFAGLPILERRPHSRPSFYIKLGLDAAVSYPSLNLRFSNDRDFPVVLGLRVEGGQVRATVWGARQGMMVSFVRRIDDTLPFEERSVDDASLPAGVRVLQQRGVPGFRVHRWRIVRDIRANQAVRTAMEDLYPPTTQIWRRGTGGPAPAGYTPPADDDHPEYTADAYLEMTQGEGVDGTAEVRRAGRTGMPGWTVRAGYTDSLSGSGALSN